jgi:DNA-binding NtrC family response regulator
MDALSRHDWPENVGELKNVIEGAAFDARNMPFILPDNPQIRKLVSGGRGASIGIGSATGSFYEWPVENILAGIESGECPVQPISAWADGMGHPKTLQLAEAAIRKFAGGHRHLSDDDAVRLFGMKQHALKTQVIDRRKAEWHG